MKTYHFSMSEINRKGWNAVTRLTANGLPACAIVVTGKDKAECDTFIKRHATFLPVIKRHCHSFTIADNSKRDDSLTPRIDARELYENGSMSDDTLAMMDETQG